MNVKPDLSSGPTCANYHPKQSDLVVTGAAEIDFSDNTGRDVDSEAEVMQSSSMVKRDWQRTFAAGAFSCLRQYLKRQTATQPNLKLVAFKRVSVARITRYTAGILTLFDATVQGVTGRVATLIVLVGTGRTEITITDTATVSIPLPLAPVVSVSALKAEALRLAHLMVMRARV